MKSTFSVMFIIQKGKLKANGKAPILARITVNGEMSHVSTKIDILPDRWLTKEYKTVGLTREEKLINQTLEELKGAARERYYSMVNRCEVVTAAKIKNSLMGLDEKSMRLLELFDQFIVDYDEVVKSGRARPETHERYRLTRRRIEEFLSAKYGMNDIPLADINHKFIKDLDMWLRNTKKQCNNTATKFLYRVTTVYKVAFANGWVHSNPFATYKTHLEKVDRGYLTKEELTRMMQKDFATKRLELIRDLFVFSCYTGFAYIDVASLTTDMLQERGEGNIWICTKRQKTGIEVNMRLLDIPLMIIEKY